jgi:hypothetical protein
MGAGHRAGPKPQDVAFVERLLSARGTAAIPHNFTPTVPAYVAPASSHVRQRGRMPTQHVRNPQVCACAWVNCIHSPGANSMRIDVVEIMQFLSGVNVCVTSQIRVG